METIQQFIARCQAHQLKITPQRVAIYREMMQTAGHPTVDQVFRRVRNEYPNISFDTVNRTLQTFMEMGILDAVEIFGGGKRFDLDTVEHHHFHCTECGRVYDFYDTDLNRVKIPEPIQGKFRITSRRLVLKGTCESCLGHQSRSEGSAS